MVDEILIKERKERKKKLLFIIPNIMLAGILVFYYFIHKETDFPYSIIPPYFLSVLAAIFTMFMIHPKARASEFKLRNSIFFSLAGLVFIIISIIVMVIVFKA